MSNISYKMTLLGDIGVGKTTLFKKLSKDNFNEKSLSTIGIDKVVVNLKINTSEGEKDAEIILYDTAGQEKFRSISISYFRESTGIILMYDISRNETFENLDDWSKDILDNLGDRENYLILLLGNKVDLVNENPELREVEEKDAKEYCANNNILWGGEFSVKNFNLEKLISIFKEFVEKMYKKIGNINDKKSETILNKSKLKKKKGIC